MKSRVSIHFLLLLMLVATTFTISACGTTDRDAASGRVTMAAESEMPAMVRSAPQRVREAYRFAAAHADDLKQIPCYCGCGPMGHNSNYACFWQENGAVDYHGLGCGICVDIAQDVMRGLKQGQSLADLRAQVDADYSRFGPPTDTPLVVQK